MNQIRSLVRMENSGMSMDTGAKLGLHSGSAICHCAYLGSYLNFISMSSSLKK